MTRILGRGTTLSAVAVAVALIAATAASAAPTPSAAPGAHENVRGAAAVARTIARIERKPRYAQADWGYTILDERSGAVLSSQNAHKMFDPGSTMKLYSTSAALSLYGRDYRFRTPVYQQGTVDGGTLTGNLVMVASGDLTFGLREQPNGTLYYENLPAVDQSYADELPGAVEPPGNPYAALDELAQKVRAAGITQVNGDVVIDDRLFEAYDGFPDGLITPMWVNENLIDLLVTPGAVGAPATVAPRPITGTYTITNAVKTVAKGKATTMTVTEPTPGNLLISGQIAAGSPPTLKIWEVDDPSAFARTAFIEALGRAGVSVTAPALGPNPVGLLPAKGSYAAADKLGEHVSATMSQVIKLILKVSYNRGADLMACLAAVKLGSTDCTVGMAAEVKHAVGVGVTASEAIPFDGAGSDDQGRTTPNALAQLLRGVARTPYGPTLKAALPILGRDGTLANVLPKQPVAGHAQIKTGNRVVGNAAGQIIVLGNSLAGYVETKSGRRVVLMIAVGNVPIPSALAFLSVVNDQAKMVAAVYDKM